jgi:Mn2+/Fe2+ NRAMP family transporter
MRGLRSLSDTLKIIGPGFAVAATGVGAGDVVTAAVAGSTYGTAILWAALAGAILKCVLNEGLARWQLSTGTSLLQGWGRHLHRAVVVAFLVYLLLWTVLVAGALMAACGLAAHSLLPVFSVQVWGVLHSVVALTLIFAGRYALFERLIKVLIAVMFVTVVASSVIVRPDILAVGRGLLIPSVPPGSGKFLLGVIGGVGGSVTLLSYNYWMRERGWTSPAHRSESRLDLGAAYVIIGIFGIALIIVAAGVRPELVTGDTMALEIADRIGDTVGSYGRWIFLIGFWGAVFTSMLGVWQGVPYIFADTIDVLRGRSSKAVETTSPFYKAYLLFIALPPMAMLLIQRPVWIVLIYSIAGAVFMPFLAITLLILNNRSSLVGMSRNGWAVNLALALAVALFAYLLVGEIIDLLFR